MIPEASAVGVLVFCLILAAGSYMYSIGEKRGILIERHRCERIVRQTWEIGGKVSPTCRRVYRSILDGDENLISEDVFFG